MNYLDRNTLPRFQERLDLAASELNDMEDIFTKAINEIAGREYVIAAMIPEEERSDYCEETVFPILDKINSLQNQINALGEKITALETKYDQAVESIESRYADFETRLNALDDAAARKEDLNVVLYRTGQE